MKKTDNFEEKISKLNTLLKELDRENLSLNDSVGLYKDGVKLLKEAREILENAKLEIEQIKAGDE